MAANTFTFTGATTVVFPVPESAGYGRQPVRTQPRGFSRGGSLYLYDRGIRMVRHKLTFKKISATVLDNLYLFFDTHTRGARSTFAWYDRGNIAHTVYLVGGINTIESNPGEYTVNLMLEERT